MIHRDSTNNGDIDGNYSPIICYIAIEHGPCIVDLPTKDGDRP